ncbi:MAG: glycine-rich protein [Bacilli bacterium]|nr:glycine-rich protein [Bacilli bacterium]
MLKKLDNRGYMLVEIVLASVIAFSVAYYLLNLTYKFKDINMGVYESTDLLNTKINITKNIMNDLEKYHSISYKTKTDYSVDLVAQEGLRDVNLRIKVSKNDSGDKIIEYGKLNGEDFIKDSSYYKRKIPRFAEFGKIEVIGQKAIKIPINSIYDDNSYDIKLYVYKQEPFPLVYVYTAKNAVQTFEAPQNGYYKIEAWGAQGGDYDNYYVGGRGSQTEGYIYLNRGTVLEINVGNQPVVSQTAYYSIGGYTGVNGSSGTSNVGGNSGWYDHGSGNNYNRGGGGAADIRLAGSGNNLNKRIMVAAGGGGAVVVAPELGGDSKLGSYFLSGAHGGRLFGDDASSLYTYLRYDLEPNENPISKNVPRGGKQNICGTGRNNRTDLDYIPGAAELFIKRTAGFGFGGGAPKYGDEVGWGGGGGAGWYGGALGHGYPGAGGSSYIAGYAGVNGVIESTKGHTNNTKSSLTPVSSYITEHFLHGKMYRGVNSGDGRVRITYSGPNAPTRKNHKLDNVRYIKDCINGNSMNSGNHWVEIQAIDSNGFNVAKGKSILNYSTVNTEWGTHNIASINDGDINSGYVQLENGNQCVTVDLGETYNLDEIAVWHYFKDGRTYKDAKTFVSNDNNNYETVMINDSMETSEGFRVSAYENDELLDIKYRGNGGTNAVNNYLISKYDAVYNVVSDDYEHSEDTTVWYDMFGNNNGSIVNGEWEKEYGESLIFNGSSTCVSLGKINSDYQTIGVTFSISSLKENPESRQYIIGNWEDGGGGIYIASGEQGSVIAGEYYIDGSYKNIKTNIVPEVGKEYSVVLTFDGYMLDIYVNGIQEGHMTVLTDDKKPAVIGVPVANTIMAIGGNPYGSTCNSMSGDALHGRVYNAYIYGRGLSPFEVSSDYKMTIAKGSNYGSFLAPTRKKYKFDGWYTSPFGGGVKINSDIELANNKSHNIYASWERIIELK